MLFVCRLALCICPFACVALKDEFDCLVLWSQWCFWRIMTLASHKTHLWYQSNKPRRFPDTVMALGGPDLENPPGDADVVPVKLIRVTKVGSGCFQGVGSQTHFYFWDLAQKKVETERGSTPEVMEGKGQGNNRNQICWLTLDEGEELKERAKGKKKTGLVRWPVCLVFI